MNNVKIVEAWMNGRFVGKIALTPESLCAFEYDADYIRSSVSISPFYLPLRTGVFIAKRNPFNGNFGVFDDSLPDGWGSLILDRYLKCNNINLEKLTILQRLALVGNNGRGALEFRPDFSRTTTAEIENFELFAAETQKILSSQSYTDSLETCYLHGGSPGGARPKIFINAENKEWLVKFRSTSDPEDIGVVEYEYSLLAKKCGIIMPKTKLFEGKYFGVERYDRTTTGKVHTISAAGLLNANYREPSLDYESLLKLCFALTKNMEEVLALFRLMVFNIAIKNRDDHAKNFSFQLINKEWKLSPAYDILPSKGFNGYHTTTVNNNGEPDFKDIMSVAEKAGINKKNALAVAEEVYDTIKT